MSGALDAAGHRGVVFSAAHRRGGVERVAWDFLQHIDGSGGRASFYGTELTPQIGPGISFVQVRPRRVPHAFAPVAFRHQARRAIALDKPSLLVSFGANCPPGDVYWVHSVHRAWLARSQTVTWRSRTVPAAIRYALPRHQVILQMEGEYFRNNAPQLILCTSQQEVEDLAEFYAVPRERMRVVPNGFDPTQFSPKRRHELRALVRSEMGAGDGDFVLLMVANELQRKGFGETLHAMARLRDPRVRLSLVGKAAPNHYGELIGRLGLEGRVRWHGPSDDVGRWHAGADALVLPTQYEPFGIVIVEALASGLPVVTTRLAGASVAITHGTCGLLQQDPRDIEELAELLRVITNADLSAWSEAAVAASAPYRWPSIFGRVDQLLEGI